MGWWGSKIIRVTCIDLIFIYYANAKGNEIKRIVEDLKDNVYPIRFIKRVINEYYVNTDNFDDFRSLSPCFREIKPKFVSIAYNRNISEKVTNILNVL